MPDLAPQDTASGVRKQLISLFDFFTRWTQPGGGYQETSRHSAYTKKKKQKVGYKERRKRKRQHMAHLMGRKYR